MKSKTSDIGKNNIIRCVYLCTVDEWDYFNGVSIFGYGFNLNQINRVRVYMSEDNYIDYEPTYIYSDMAPGEYDVEIEVNGLVDCYNMFGDTHIVSCDFSDVDTSNITNCQYMFYYTKIKNSPFEILPIEVLTANCCSYMFAGCKSLTKAPVLPATELVDGCYESMFSGCSSLTYIKALFLTTPSDSYTYNWVVDVSPTGTFVKNPESTWNELGENAVPDGWTIKFDFDGEDEELIEYNFSYEDLSLGETYWFELPGYGDIFRADALYVLDKYGKVKESGSNTIKYCYDLPAFYSIKADNVRFTKLEAVYNGDVLQYLNWFGSDGRINYEMELENYKFTFYKYANV